MWAFGSQVDMEMRGPKEGACSAAAFENVTRPFSVKFITRPISKAPMLS